MAKRKKSKDKTKEGCTGHEPAPANARGCSMKSQQPGKRAETKGGEDKRHDSQRERPWKNNCDRSKRHPPAEVTPQTDTQETQSTPTTPVEHGPDGQSVREAMIRYLVNNHPRPHDSACDIRVECSPYTWLLHRSVIQQCPFFADLFPPPRPPNASGIDNASDSVAVIQLHSHVPEQLAHVFHYMYFHIYPGADYDTGDYLVADSVLTNTAMYLAGASVGYQDMMHYAVRKIEAWSTAVLADNEVDSGVGGLLQRAVQHQHQHQHQHDSTMDYALLRLADPLRRSLTIVYEQPSSVRDGLLAPLRLVLVRIVDAALPYLATNEAFRVHYRNEWTGPMPMQEDVPKRTLPENVLLDHAHFQDLGVLHRPSADKHAAAASIAYLFGLLDRLASIEVWTSTPPVAAATATSKPANDGDDRTGRDGRGDAGDHRDWRPWIVQVGDALSEHATVVRELERCLYEKTLYRIKIELMLQNQFWTPIPVDNKKY